MISKLSQEIPGLFAQKLSFAVRAFFLPIMN